MSLQLIYGKIGSGKTSYCIKQAIESNRRVYFITPEQYTFTAEKRFCSLLNVHGLGGVEVISFKRLADRILSTARGAALPRLTKRTKGILLQKILVEAAPKLTVLKGLAKQQGSLGPLSALFSEMKRYRISTDDLRKGAEENANLEPKLSDIALLYEAYEAAVENRFRDGDDDFFRLAKAVQESSFFDDAEVFLDKFDGMDAGELSVVEAILAKGVKVTATICYHPDDEKLPPFQLHVKFAKQLRGVCYSAGAQVLPDVILDRKRPAVHSLQKLENAFFKYPTPSYEEIPEGLYLTQASNPFEEVHHVARRVLALCREKGYLFRDIAIAVRNTEGYERFLEAILPSYGIPLFMDRSIHILEHPFTVFVLSALELITKGYTYETVFRYVKSGFLRLPQDKIDSLENYVLATGIRGKIWIDAEKWNVRYEAYTQKSSADEEMSIAEADDTRRKIVNPLLKLQEGLLANKTASGKCRVLYSFLEDMKVEKRISALCRLFEKAGDFAMAAEYRGVYNDFIEALDGVCDAFGDENIGIRRLYDILRVALGEVETGIIPSSLDGVSVGSIDRIKGYAVKALFVLGVQDGVFPAPTQRTGILTDGERSKLSDLGLSFATVESKIRFEEEHLIYKCLTIASEYMEFSFPASGMEGGTRYPSRVYERIKEIFPNVPQKNLLLGLSSDDKITAADRTLQYLLYDLKKGTADEKMRMAYGWLCEKRPQEMKQALSSLTHTNKNVPLSGETMKAYLGKTINASVSRLERLAACPFSYYATYILNAKERKIMQPSSLEAGVFLHDFLDIFSKRLHENGVSWKEVTKQYIDEEFMQIVPLLDRRLSPYMLETSPRYAQFFARLKSAVRTSVRVLAEHMKNCAFEPLGYELSFSENGDLAPLSFSLPWGGAVKLSGRIDRADILRDPEKEGALLRIIDYKSGSKTFSLSDVYFGLNLQLAVYMTALCAPENEIVMGKNAKPAGILYFRLIDPVIDASPMETPDVLESMRQKKFKLSGLVLSDEDVLRAMDKDLGTSSDILPAKITKSGVGGSVATEKQFATLSRYVQKTVKDLIKILGDGHLDISPYKKSDGNACEFCPYGAFCAHDGSKYRELQKFSAEEVWEEMEAETCK